MFIQRLVGVDAAAAWVAVAVALGGSADPTGETVGNIASVAVGSDTVLELASGGDGTRVVDSSGAVEGRDVATTRLVDAVGETVTRVGSGSTLKDHLVDGLVGARVLNPAVVVAGSLTIVVLHQTGVANSVVGGVNADAATRLLHDDGENEAVVDTSGGSGLLDTIPDGSNLGTRVVGLAEPATGVEHSVLVVVEHVLEAHPAALGRPASTSGTVPPVHGVAVRAGACTVLDVVLVVSGKVAVTHTLTSLATLNGGTRSRGLGHVVARSGALEGEVGNLGVGSGVLGKSRRVRDGSGSAGQESSESELHCEGMWYKFEGDL